MIQFEWVVNIGNIITITIIVIGGIVGLWRRLIAIERHLAKLEDRTNLVWRWFEKEHDINGGEHQ